MQDNLPSGFAISDTARSGIEQLKSQLTKLSPSDPPAVASVGWGWKLDETPDKGNVAVGFYPRSREDDLASSVETVSGVSLVFHVQEERRHHFVDAILDGDPERGFFLRQR